MTAQLHWRRICKIVNSSIKYFFLYKSNTNFYKIRLWAHKLFVKWICGVKAPENNVSQHYLSAQTDLVSLKVDRALIVNQWLYIRRIIDHLGIFCTFMSKCWPVSITAGVKPFQCWNWIMALCRTGDKPSLEPMLTQFTDTFKQH